MDDVGNIIYVVVTIIAIVFSILKKANADKKTAPPQDSEGEKTMPSFEDFFNSQQEEVVTEPKVAVKKKEHEQDSIQAKKREMDQKMVRIKKKDDNNSAYNITEEKVGKKGTSWFNARDAIIYSEIMKRPEF